MVAAAALICAGTQVMADRFGPWDFDRPSGMEQKPGIGHVTYSGDSGSIMFLPQTALEGTTAAALLQKTATALFSDTERAKPRRIEAPDGQRLRPSARPRSAIPRRVRWG